MPFTTLIDPARLEAHLHDPAYAIVDCRFRLNEPDWGEQAYAEGHIPHACYAHLNRDLASAPTGENGRHPLPDVTALERTFGRLGIDRGVQVVAYDQDNGMYASRLWWLLRWLGHDAAAVLDGGLAGWVAAGGALTTAACTRTARPFRADLRAEWTVNAADIEAAIVRGDWRLLDARAADRFTGSIEPIDRVAGHIPGARNHHFLANVDERGRFLPPEVLKAGFDDALAGASPTQAISYCGSGVTACHNLLAMEHAGLKGAKLYPGSWSEWSSDPARPVETGGTKTRQ